MGSKGSQTSQTNQTSTYNPAGLSYLTNALQQGQNAAQLGFNIPQAPVAGFAPQQQQAFGQTGQFANAAQPYFGQAANYFNQAATPNVGQFFNPFAGAVGSQLQNIFGQQASQNTGQLTQAAGGIGADRIAVGQSELANQQGLAAGQVFANLFQPALGAAQNEQGIQQSIGQNFANLGQNVQGAGLSGAQALLGTGGLQQQLSQAQLNSPYQLALAQAAFPYQQAQFNAGITGALAPAMGGTTTGQSNTTSQFNPSLAGQIGGGIATLAGPAGYFFGSAGGAVPNNPYASGGGVDDEPIDISRGFIPMGHLSPAQAHIPQLNLNPQTAQQSGSNTGKGSGANQGTSAGLMSLAKLFGPTYGAGYADGGGAGEVDDPTRDAGLEMLRAKMLDTGYKLAQEPFRMPDQAATQAWRDSSTPPDAPAFAPTAAPASPYQSPAPPDDAGAPQAAAAAPSPALAAAAPEGKSPEGKSFAGFLRSPYAALTLGGLEAMKTGSLASGMQAGMKTFQGQETASQGAQKLMQEAERLQMEAQQQNFAQTQMTPYQKATLDRSKFIPMGQLMTGSGEVHPLVMDQGVGKVIDAVTGQAPVSGDQYQGKGAGQPLPPETLSLMADSYIAGDHSVVSGLGYGTVGAQNRAALLTAIQKKATTAGLSGADLAAAKVDLMASGAGARTSAQQSARIESAAAEAANTIPLARQASAAVPRGNWVPWNTAMQAVQAGTSSPQLAKFVAANQAVITAYAAAMNRGAGVTTVDARHHAEMMFSTATSPQAYNAVLDQIELEIGAAKAAPDAVRQKILNHVSGRGSPAQGGAPQMGERKQFKQGWGVWNGSTYVPEGAQ